MDRPDFCQDGRYHISSASTYGNPAHSQKRFLTREELLSINEIDVITEPSHIELDNHYSSSTSSLDSIEALGEENSSLTTAEDTEMSEYLVNSSLSREDDARIYRLRESSSRQFSSAPISSSNARLPDPSGEALLQKHARCSHRTYSPVDLTTSRMLATRSLNGIAPSSAVMDLESSGSIHPGLYQQNLGATHYNSVTNCNINASYARMEAEPFNLELPADARRQLIGIFSICPSAVTTNHKKIRALATITGFSPRGIRRFIESFQQTGLVDPSESRSCEEATPRPEKAPGLSIVHISCLKSKNGQRANPQPRNRKRRYVCVSGCGMTFKDKLGFQRHMALNYPLGEWRCRECGHISNWLRKDKAIEHWRKKHSNSKIELHEAIEYQDYHLEFEQRCGFCGEPHWDYKDWLDHVCGHLEDDDTNPPYDMRRWQEPWRDSRSPSEDESLHESSSEDEGGSSEDDDNSDDENGSNGNIPGNTNYNDNDWNNGNQDGESGMGDKMQAQPQDCGSNSGFSGLFLCHISPAKAENQAVARCERSDGFPASKVASRGTELAARLTKLNPLIPNASRTFLAAGRCLAGTERGPTRRQGEALNRLFQILMADLDEGHDGLDLTRSLDPLGRHFWAEASLSSRSYRPWIRTFEDTRFLYYDALVIRDASLVLSHFRDGATSAWDHELDEVLQPARDSSVLGDSSIHENGGRTTSCQSALTSCEALLKEISEKLCWRNT